MSEHVPFTPVQSEVNVLAAVNDIGKSVGPRGDAYEAYEMALMEYELAFDKAYEDAEGAQAGRKYKAGIATEALKRDMVIKKIAHKRAEMWGKALEQRLTGYQSVGKSVNGAYSAAGTWER